MKSNFCSECGAQLKEEDRFCPECGYNISEEYNSVPETPKPVESQGYYNPPMEEYNEDRSTPEESLYEPDVSLDEQEESEFDPFKQNADAKTTIYGQHSRQSRNMFLLGLVVILVLSGIIFLVILFIK
ncbi:zinc ribbon domain-containing protein [Clostridium vincentii]|uniref:Double zinc ribbon n=1 Tax=Clostridium vincentii TaxID=52704 RepID=A0A2T0BIH8_9CLOT|nr:zinc ribbon domain-containing protein [Clostridium vincentii]PRR83695.1 Double zinc ribbon [Clostridium vincentii]